MSPGFPPFLLDDAAAPVHQEDAAHPGDRGRAAVRGKGAALEIGHKQLRIISKMFN